MNPFNPLAGTPEDDADDLALVRRIEGGDRDALEALVVRHQPWIYNIVVRMVYHPHDAEDVTQEVPDQGPDEAVDVRGPEPLPNLALPDRRQPRPEHEAGREPRRRSGPLKIRRGARQRARFGAPGPTHRTADVQLLIDEARITCSSGMLLCLSREQRLAYVLGEIFGVSDAIGAELLATTRDNFRQSWRAPGATCTTSCRTSAGL